MNTTEIMKHVEQSYLRKNAPDFRAGDTVRVWTKIIEGDAQRLQPFEGIIIRRKGSGMKETFSVRKISYGIGVERTFNLSSPMIDKIELIKHGKVRRAKLYYLRNVVGRAAKINSTEAEKQEPAATAEAGTGRSVVPVEAATVQAVVPEKPEEPKK
ncbi:MAG: 50S ribosomal protein L19 [Elusimicrobiota bacterium]